MRMSLSLHDTGTKSFAQGLRGLSIVFAKAQAAAEAGALDPATLMSARLAPDMLPFPRQVQIACDHAKGAMSRLAGQEVPRWEDTETTLADLAARIARTQAHVEGFVAEDFDGAVSRTISLKVGPATMEFPATDYLVTFALPNFWFHTTMAYALIRAAGVGIGKGDFMGRS